MLNELAQSPFVQYLHTPFLLLILVILEAVLSADNAVALASIAQGLESPQVQRRALNIGLLGAYVLRMTLIVTATWVQQFWQFELIGALYLLWLVWRYYTAADAEGSTSHGFTFASLWQAIPVIALTDLAFSLDSVTTAIAVSDQTWLIVTGGTLGVIALRFLTELFLRWLREYPRLEEAGYLTVAMVGTRLLMRVMVPGFNLPEWLMVIVIAAIFTWGFSRKSDIRYQD
ncbi:TerC family protein [Spirulina major]|uniref:TerC family protein n=1 Tax=Spirulina major TaxID=270636 RepID=UPI000934FF14|nr:DUF475 domain-containing protein [Spirulina major]